MPAGSSDKAADGASSPRSDDASTADVPSPGSDHGKNKPSTLLKQDLVDIRIARADLVRHVRNIELDWPTATRFKVDEQRTALRAEYVA